MPWSRAANAIRSSVARRIRTRAFFQFRAEFMPVLAKEIAKAIEACTARRVTLQCSGLTGRPTFVGNRSRLRALRISVDMFSDVQFYDYTKLPNRKNIPANYHLTFSLADGNDTFARVALANGMNVAAVFRSKETVARYMESGIDIGGTCVPVSRGDDTDLRFLDMPRHCIGLYAKGNAKRDTTAL